MKIYQIDMFIFVQNRQNTISSRKLDLLRVEKNRKSFEIAYSTRAEVKILTADKGPISRTKMVFPRQLYPPSSQ